MYSRRTGWRHNPGAACDSHPPIVIQLPNHINEEDCDFEESDDNDYQSGELVW